MPRNSGDVVKYLEENSKLLPKWFQHNYMMMSHDKCHSLLHDIDTKSITVGNYFSIKSPNDENYNELYLIIKLPFNLK